MDTEKLLKYLMEHEQTQQEEAQFLDEVAKAYHRDEASMSSQDVLRMVEKVRARLKGSESDAN